MRSNLNGWHFLCGRLTLSPQILQRPLVCHWKATNLSVTTCDVSPVILPLAFQKQFLHPHHSQQINLCILPDHRLLPAPPRPAPPSTSPLYSLRQPSGVLSANTALLLDSDFQMELNNTYQLLPCGLNSTLYHPVPYKR